MIQRPGIGLETFKSGRLLLSFLLLFVVTSVALSQQSKFAFRSLSISEGLSQSSVISIVQDKKGLMWFGTRGGLNRFDGKGFTVFKHSENDSSSISNNDITSVIVDANGDLWIGTFNGLNKYDYSKDRFVHFMSEPSDSTTISDNSIWAILEASNGSIWVGTANGLNRYDPKSGRFERFYNNVHDEYSLSHNYVNDVFEDSKGIIWIATSGGLNKLTRDKDGKRRFIRYTHRPGDKTSLKDNYTQTISEDAYGNLWVGTKYGGLNKYHRETASFKGYVHDPERLNSISNNDVRSLSFDKQGRLWIGTYYGLNLLYPEENRFYRFLNDKDDPNSLSKNSIKSMFIDNNGSLWVGTYYGGVNFLDPQNSNFKHYKKRPGPNGLSFEVTSDIIEGKQGDIYIGTEGGGVNIFNERTREFRYIQRDKTKNTLTSNNIKSLLLDKDNLWIGTYNGGLNILDLKTDEFTHYINDPLNANSLSDDDVYSIVQQNDSLFWLGTHGGGLNLLNRNSGQFTHFREGEAPRLTSDLLRVLFRDSKGNLWVGTQYGLNFLSHTAITTGNIGFSHYFYDEKKQFGEDILTIFEDSRSRIWVGTSESGLSMLDPVKGEFINFNAYMSPESPLNVVHGILEDDHQNLWISASQRILKFNLSDSTIKFFNESDGLVGNEFNNNSCLKTSSGEMYFGNLAGVTHFNPDSIITNQYAPAVVLMDFKLFGRSVNPSYKGSVLEKALSSTGQITLDYDQAIFTIVFAIPNYINSDKNVYAYRLKGLEEKWNVTGENSATYTIQQPGTYTFEVRGANNDGIWNTAPTTLKVMVKPAPWRTWWAFLGYGIIILIALFLLINIILSRSRFKHDLELEYLNSEREKALNRMKIQFFTNISHEFRTPLVLILGPLEQIISNYKGGNKLYKKLLTIEKNATTLLKLINQLMDFRKLEHNLLQLKAAQGNIVAFLKEIYLSFRQHAKLHHISYEFNCQEDSIMAWYDRDKMERVIFNLLANAFKYTPDEGKIKVSVRLLEDDVEIEISDNGMGIAPEDLKRIFDRFYEGENGNHQPSSRYNKGTGIGLALAKGIVELHSGQIGAESHGQQGSTFTVTLPLGNSHLNKQEIIKDFKSSEDITLYERKDYSSPQAEEIDNLLENTEREAEILVVEDNDELRKYMVQLFSPRYKVREATDGREGLKQALGSVPDIIISDVMMPGMDGIEFCLQIKSNIKTSHVPFILLTARTSLIFKYEGLEMGADDYINKPFNIKELQLKVKNLINSQKKLREKFASQSIIKPSEITVSSIDEKLLKKALHIVDENISNELFDIPTFCEELGVSRTMLFTKIKAWTNLTPNEFIQLMRLKRAAFLLEQNKFNVGQIGFQVGFKNPKYFSKCFQRHYSVTPTEYARKFTVNDKVETSRNHLSGPLS